VPTLSNQVCANCGNMLRAGAKFCKECGAKVIAPTIKPATAPTIRYPKEKKAPPELLANRITSLVLGLAGAVLGLASASFSVLGVAVGLIGLAGVAVVMRAPKESGIIMVLVGLVGFSVNFGWLASLLLVLAGGWTLATCL